MGVILFHLELKKPEYYCSLVEHKKFKYKAHTWKNSIQGIPGMCSPKELNIGELTFHLYLNHKKNKLVFFKAREKGGFFSPATLDIRGPSTKKMHPYILSLKSGLINSLEKRDSPCINCIYKHQYILTGSCEEIIKKKTK